MLKNRFSPALLALLVAIATTGSVYAADITSETPAIDTPTSITETVVTSGEAQTPAAIEAPAVETPAAETPEVIEAPVVEAPAAEAPAVESPTAETPAVEAPVTEPPIAEVPAVETPAPVAATLTITHRLVEGEQTFDIVETVDGLFVGQTVDVSQFVKGREGITCISPIENISLAEQQNSIILEYKPSGDESGSSSEVNE